MTMTTQRMRRETLAQTVKRLRAELDAQRRLTDAERTVGTGWWFELEAVRRAMADAGLSKRFYEACAQGQRDRRAYDERMAATRRQARADAEKRATQYETEHEIAERMRFDCAERRAL